MRLWVLGSGSMGNAILLESGESRVLIDAGFPPSVIASRLAQIGVAVEAIHAVVITHEHADHARGAFAGARKWGWSVHATKGTARGLPESGRAGIQTFDSSATFAVGDFTIQPVRVSHDAVEPVALVATETATGVRAAVAYDVGCATDSLRRSLGRLDILVLEANHDEEMLRYGPYPPSVQRRIAGGRGHLSNHAAGELARDSAHRGLAHLVLAHISPRCNNHAVARETVKKYLAGTRYPGEVETCGQFGVAGPFEARGGTLSTQLSLGL